MSIRSVMFQMIGAFDNVAVAFSSWVTLISFYEADFWHFTDPSTSGVSLEGAIVLFLSFCIIPLFLASKKIRLLQINVVIVLLLKTLPALLLMISSLPQLSRIPWARTGLLAFGVAILPLVFSWILFQRTDCSPTAFKSRRWLQKSSGVLSTQDRAGIDNSDGNPKKSTQQSRDNFVDVIVLTAILLSMSIRYCTVTINIFYEDWMYSCALFIFVFLLALLRSVLEHVKEKDVSKSSTASLPNALTDTAVVNNRSSYTVQINLADRANSKQENNRTSSVNIDNSLDNSRNLQSAPNEQNVSNWTFALIVNVSGCVHGITIGLLVLLFVWFFSTPNFFCRLSNLEPYYNGVFVVLGLMFGVLSTLLFRPEKLCATSCDAKQNTLSEKQITMRILVKLGFIAVLLASLLCTATALLLRTQRAGSFIGSILFCLTLPYCFTINVQSLSWIVSTASNFGKTFFMCVFPGIFAFLTGLSFIVFTSFLIFFINPQLTSAFLGNMGLILGPIVACTILSLITFILIVFTLAKPLDNNNHYGSSFCKCKLAPSSWIENLRRKVPSDLRCLLKYGLTCVVVAIVTLLVGPQLNQTHCITCYKDVFENISDGTPVIVNGSSPSNFSVLSWNLLFGHDKFGRDSLPCVAKVLNIFQPDVTALQESDPLPPYWGGKDILGYLAASRATTAYAGVKVLQSSLGVGFLTSFTVTNHQRFILEEDNEQRLPHYSLVQIDCIINNQPVSVFNLHAVFKNWTGTPENPSPFANLSATHMQFIAEKANRTSLTRPTIVMGDFNLNPNESELDIFFDLGFESALSMNRELVPPSTINNRFAVIDHIFFKKLILLESSVINSTTEISDHFPILARFQLPT